MALARVVVVVGPVDRARTVVVGTIGRERAGDAAGIGPADDEGPGASRVVIAVTTLQPRDRETRIERADAGRRLAESIAVVVEVVGGGVRLAVEAGFVGRRVAALVGEDEALGDPIRAVVAGRARVRGRARGRGGGRVAGVVLAARLPERALRVRLTLDAARDDRPDAQVGAAGIGRARVTIVALVDVGADRAVAVGPVGLAVEITVDTIGAEALRHVDELVVVLVLVGDAGAHVVGVGGDGGRPAAPAVEVGELRVAVGRTIARGLTVVVVLHIALGSAAQDLGVGDGAARRVAGVRRARVHVVDRDRGVRDGAGGRIARVHGTRVAVVNRCECRMRDRTGRRIAGVGGARVRVVDRLGGLDAVVVDHRRGEAGVGRLAGHGGAGVVLHALVSRRALVVVRVRSLVVVAAPGHGRLLGAPVHRGRPVERARVAVVAARDADQPFVDLRVAVVVDAIAHLGRGIDADARGVDAERTDAVLRLRAVEPAVEAHGRIVVRVAIAVAGPAQGTAQGREAELLGSLVRSRLAGLADHEGDVPTGNATFHDTVTIHVDVVCHREGVVAVVARLRRDALASAEVEERHGREGRELGHC